MNRSSKKAWILAAAGLVSVVPLAALATEAATPAPATTLDARLSPVFEGSQQIGYRVIEVRRGTDFDALGLKSGDIVKSIDGSSLESAGRLTNAWRGELPHGKRIVVDLVREGQEFAFVYTVP